LIHLVLDDDEDDDYDDVDSSNLSFQILISMLAHDDDVDDDR
jgi:hypothetical protein